MSWPDLFVDVYKSSAGYMREPLGRTGTSYILLKLSLSRYFRLILLSSIIECSRSRATFAEKHKITKFNMTYLLQYTKYPMSCQDHCSDIPNHGKPLTRVVGNTKLQYRVSSGCIFPPVIRWRSKMPRKCFLACKHDMCFQFTEFLSTSRLGLL